MKKSEFCSLLARRLGVPDARVKSILEELHGSGAVKPEKGCRRYPADIHEGDAVAIFLAVLADRQVNTVVADAEALANITGEAGRFWDWVLSVLYGRPRRIAHLAVQHDPPAATSVLDGQHVRFGGRVEKAGRIIMGHQMAAINFELRGMSASDADAAAAIQGI